MILAAICDLQAKPLLAAAKAALAVSPFRCSRRKKPPRGKKNTKKTKNLDRSDIQLETEPLDNKTTYTME